MTNDVSVGLEDLNGLLLSLLLLTGPRGVVAASASRRALPPSVPKALAGFGPPGK